MKSKQLPWQNNVKFDPQKELSNLDNIKKEQKETFNFKAQRSKSIDYNSDNYYSKSNKKYGGQNYASNKTNIIFTTDQKGRNIFRTATPNIFSAKNSQSHNLLKNQISHIKVGW